jgi:hypothetical protein
MAVSVRYTGRFGNNIMQYMAARLLASKLDVPLVGEFPHNRILPVTAYPQTEKFTNPITLTDDSYDPANFDKLDKNRDYWLNGYFQQSRFYNKHREEIKAYFRQYVIEANDRAIGMHVRLKDYRWNIEGKNRVISASWYIKILESIKFDELIIVTDDPSDSYLRNFDRFKPRKLLTYGGPFPPEYFIADWNLLGNFERVICSNSSFCWTAVFLGYAEHVWTFKRSLGADIPHTDFANLDFATVVDGKFESEEA